MKLDKKYENILFSAIMAILMGFFMSIIITYVNVGLTENFIAIWVKAFITGVITGFPVTLIIAPISRTMVHKMIIK
ncbi:MAG: DUF2798 domain-containing protein [Gammaproteobacteria bacterium]|nr:DUF2798 domain-containing protein [Gammaproteobacteria bacterium]